MADMEKVIKGLEIHADRSDKTDCNDCPYSKDGFSKGNCIGQLCSDALSLLKEQPEIVRCRECKLKNNCEVQIAVYDPDWYCADGKRR